MRRWKHTVNIKDLLSDDTSPETVRRLCQELPKRFAKFDRDDDLDLDEVLADFEDLANEPEPSCADFNAILSSTIGPTISACGWGCCPKCHFANATA